MIVGVCVPWFCLPVLPGGKHRGVTTGLYFVFVSQFCLPVPPGGSVHGGVTTGLCFDCWCWCDTALIVSVGVTQL